MPKTPRSSSLRRTILAAAFLQMAAPARAASFLPEAFAHLEAARYVPDDEDQVWTGWIGAGADLVRAGRVTVEFTADVETVMGRELRTFDPTQANYHLSGAARVIVAGDEVTPFFHHVSRHEVDRPKTQAVDWNLIGVRTRVAVLDGRGRVTVSVGRVIGHSPVGYEWELAARGEFEPVKRVYAAADVRRVTAEPVPHLPRGSFTDWAIEGGVRWRNGTHSLDLFAAFERRNDVFVQAPGVRDRLLLGFRVGPPGRMRMR